MLCGFLGVRRRWFLGELVFVGYWWDHPDFGVSSLAVVEDFNPCGHGFTCLVSGGPGVSVVVLKF